MGELEHGEGYESPLPEFTEEPGIGRSVALFLAGIGIGAGMALLLTPKRGDEVRDAIGRGYRNTMDDLSERAQDVRDRVHDLRERAPNLLRFARRRGERRSREG